MWIIYDSDGNPIAATGRASRVGALIEEHYALVDRTPSADEPFVTVKRETRNTARRARRAKIASEHDPRLCGQCAEQEYR